MHSDRKLSFLTIKIFNQREAFLSTRMVSQRIIHIQDSLDKSEPSLSFQEFQTKYDFRTSFLYFYQVMRAIPKILLTEAQNLELPPKENYLGNYTKIELAEGVEIDPQKARAKDFY